MKDDEFYIAKFSKNGDISPIFRRPSDGTWWCYMPDWKDFVGPFSTSKETARYLRFNRRKIMRWRKDKPKKEIDNVLIFDKTGKIVHGSFKFSPGIDDIRFLSDELAIVYFLEEVVAWCNVNRPRV
jgi:hypothetical protein